MLERSVRGSATVGADRAYDTRDFVWDLRAEGEEFALIAPTQHLMGLPTSSGFESPYLGQLEANVRCTSATAICFLARIELIQLGRRWANVARPHLLSSDEVVFDQGRVAVNDRRVRGLRLQLQDGGNPRRCEVPRI